ncbi:MAG: Holliday junction resolvase RuvX [Proteobacteria bacterium]|nr:MAG: Holliday junction resolvase RuvX [Pseudomonadota bacterium]PIE17304.1 MAG: Holliday junction resolvase RuvX [Pseudomonadota bacterium]
MGRLLGLDIGEKTIGLAVSDEGRVLASPLRTLARRGGKHDLRAVAEARDETGAEALVLGLPLGLDGLEGLSARRARRLGQALREHLGCPVHYQDERFTTVEAERVLREAELSRGARKAVVDQVAAVLILQGFLDSASREGSV